MKLQGQIHIVVGGATGWGRAVAEQIAIEGGHAVVVDSEAAALRETVAAILARGGTCTACEADIASQPALDAAARRLGESGLRPRSLTTHYMMVDWHSVEDCDIAMFERVVLNNLVGPVKAVKAFLPWLKSAGKAAILHLGSIDGLHGNPRVASYSAAKGGLVPLTRIMAFDFAKYDIRVNAIATGQMIQVAAGDVFAESVKGIQGFPGLDYALQLCAANPLKRFGPLTEWAKAATFLISDDSDYMTGTTMVVDCGRLSITPGTA